MAEDTDASRCAHEDLTMDDGRGDKFIARAKVITRAGLIAVVKLARQITGIVGMQNGWIAVLSGPHDAELCSVGRDAGGGARIPRAVGSYRCRVRLQFCKGKPERSNNIALPAVVKRTVE